MGEEVKGGVEGDHVAVRVAVPQQQVGVGRQAVGGADLRINAAANHRDHLEIEGLRHALGRAFYQVPWRKGRRARARRRPATRAGSRRRATSSGAPWCGGRREGGEGAGEEKVIAPIFLPDKSPINCRVGSQCDGGSARAAGRITRGGSALRAFARANFFLIFSRGQESAKGQRDTGELEDASVRLLDHLGRVVRAHGVRATAAAALLVHRLAE